MSTAVIDTTQPIDVKQLVMDAVRGLHVEWPAHEKALAATLGSTKQPTFKELLAYAQKHGPDGVLESATHLSDADFTKLQAACSKLVSKRGRR